MTHNQRESEKKGKKLREEREELLDKAARARDDRAKHEHPPTTDEGQVPRPPKDDPRFGQPSTQADQVNVPTGGTTGGAMGGSAKRKKDHAG